MPSEVESPICATEVHDVRSGWFGPPGPALLAAPACGALPLLCLTEPDKADKAREPPPRAAVVEVTGTATTPASPAHATSATPVAPVTAALFGTPTPADWRGGER